MNVPKSVFSAVFKVYFFLVLFYVYLCNSSGIYVCYMYSGALRGQKRPSVLSELIGVIGGYELGAGD